MKRLLLALCSGMMLAGAAFAVQPGEQLPDPAQEARARALSSELRCLVCQNQSIDDSDAPLAKDLRAIVRDRINAGESDAAIRDFLVSRYGEFVLLKPPFSNRTVVLWLLPAFALLLGLFAARSLFTRRRSLAANDNDETGAVPLSAQERADLQAILPEAPPQH
jgi:cytochrome c-type biogenesis protein CcmH